MKDIKSACWSLFFVTMNTLYRYNKASFVWIKNVNEISLWFCGGVVSAFSDLIRKNFLNHVLMGGKKRIGLLITKNQKIQIVSSNPKTKWNYFKWGRFFLAQWQSDILFLPKNAIKDSTNDSQKTPQTK